MNKERYKEEYKEGTYLLWPSDKEELSRETFIEIYLIQQKTKIQIIKIKG